MNQYSSAVAPDLVVAVSLVVPFTPILVGLMVKPPQISGRSGGAVGVGAGGGLSSLGGVAEQLLLHDTLASVYLDSSPWREQYFGGESLFTMSICPQTLLPKLNESQVTWPL